MNIKAIVIGSILGVVLHYAIVALGLLISYALYRLFQKTRKNKEQV